MKNFLDHNFLLSNSIAEQLFHEYAKDQPIIDYHSHLSPADINHSRKFENLTEAWLEGDHYKWRAMRTCGVDENYVTGDASDMDKFKKWAETVPKTLRNPLYHWTHLELQRYFDINDLLNASTAEGIFENASNQLRSEQLSCTGILSKMNVKVVCTTDDPTDDLKDHEQIATNDLSVKVLPTFRPDKAYAFDNNEAYKKYLNHLEDVAGISIRNLPDLLQALAIRIDYFDSKGCKLSDHGLEKIPLNKGNHDPEKTFIKIINDQPIDANELQELQYYMLVELGKMYHSKGWTQQFHLGALRNNSDRMMRELGPDTGFDSIGDFSQAVSLSRFLNELDSSGQLSKTILYNLNPADNEVMGTMIGNFNDGSVAGKMQFGSAWWFLDQKDGMENQINTLSNMGILSQFVGMLTDSRSFLSFPRHEYFRRILCNMIGNDVENGELPKDIELLGNLVKDICYRNAQNYFGFDMQKI